ncbi:MAG: septum formation protein Maf [Ferrovum sp. 37-45-19]|uniref:Maf family protein n=1 Tax=Ferrovum sp. JA12 TaxID=1356299 RepID=UPI0007027F8E|nr:Maf family nucleotide pyrophosphatase [Ferrovum sp. JA12]OYV80334.1 MAG: septum formation protein Maf [Ferrovum sp. 21-44-67]OYV95078.1 MAG: septum formation protein Maf [Ferrovum sp. 37-45-19]OZB31804.1 MAG: septum formation protein Maf [Ferrovum sp. 34-44-207]HQT80858.1 Maf family nucleotide pyrophosphatase [Ferrovaceae bacterium]KRH78699.1 Maf-like protein YceF [Ferrovum sp. JA12]
MSLILASSSPYRKQLLERLHLSFECVSPFIDETPSSGESARDLAHRLSIEKARAVAQQFPQSVIIGSDQCADLAGQLINKPGNYSNAVNQLTNASGKEMVFYSGLAVVCLSQSIEFSSVVETRVKYKHLTDKMIHTYLEKDKPFDCAGSGKIESLGIALVEWVKSDDPSALIGLPLIKTVEFLIQCGVELL